MRAHRLLALVSALLLGEALGNAQEAMPILPRAPSLPPGLFRPADCPPPGSRAAADRPDCPPLPPPIRRSERPANEAGGGSPPPTIAGGSGPPPEPSGGQGAPRPRIGAVQGPSLGTRFFVPAVAALPRGFGAVGVVAFPHPPVDAAERARNVAICRAYVTALPDSQDALAQAPRPAANGDAMPRTDLAMPLSVRAPAAADRAIALCQTAVDNYAYVAADGWLADLPERMRLDPSARGPLLIAWAPAASRGDPRAPVLTFDLSSYDQLPTMVSAFGIWKREIENRPTCGGMAGIRRAGGWRRRRGSIATARASWPR